MAVTYTWSIPNAERDLVTGGIQIIHWVCEATEGEHRARLYGAKRVSFDASADDFIPYDDVTEQNCIDWVQAVLDVPVLEARLAEKIEESKQPETESGVPW